MRRQVQPSGGRASIRRSSSTSVGVVVAVGVALALKFFLFLYVVRVKPQAVVTIDTGTYLRPALALLHHGSFSPGPEVVPEPEINRTPGYPALVAAAWRLLGERPWVPSLLGALLSAGTALVTARLATRLFGGHAGVAAAILVSFEPGTFLRSLEILSDTPFVFVLMLFVSALVGYAGGAGTSPVRAGFWLALATLVRPLSYYLLPLGVLFVFVVARRQGRSFRAACGVAAAFLLPALLLVGGWQARNLARANAFILSPIAGSELYFYRAVPVLARAEGVPIPEMQEKLGNRERWYRSGGGTEREIFGDARYADLFPATRQLSLIELNARWRRQAVAIIASHPVLAAAMAAKGAALLLLTPPSLIMSVRYALFLPDATLLALYEDQRLGPFALRLARAAPRLFAVSVVLVALLAALWGAALGGLWLARRDVKTAVHIVLLGTFLYVLIVTAGFEASDDRYRLPLIPIACMYAARFITKGSCRATPER
jgi:4-amino-4-deoxy-L-arabinose transferase-like glycosyltransferase